MFYYITTLSLLTIISIFIWKNSKLKKENYKLAIINKKNLLFFGILTHDLRRPIASFANFLQLRQNAPEIISPEDAIAFELKTIDNTNYLLAHLESLLFWCKTQMQSYTPLIEPVKVFNLFEEIHFLYKNDLKIQFNINQSLNDHLILTDKYYLRIILANLTSNAIKAVESVKDGKVEWYVRKNNDYITLIIHDNGKGLSKEEIEIVKGIKTASHLNQGFGLQIIYELAKNISCRIEIVSDHTGTTYNLLLKNCTNQP